MEILKKSTASLLALLLTFCTLFMFSSCGEAPADVPEETGSETVSGSEDIPEAEPSFVISSSVEYDVTVVRSSDTDEVLDSLAVSFAEKLSDMTGKHLLTSKDSVNYGAADTYEILVGNTNRAATAKLKEMLASHGGNCYGVLVDGSKVAVCGTGLPLTYRALDYVFTDLLSDGEDGAKVLSLEDGFTYIADGGENESGDVFEIADLLALGRGIRFQGVEKVASIPPYSGYWTMQGGGTDGKYAYYCMIDSASPTTCRIIKYNTSDWCVRTVSEPLEIGHANDLTYDPTRDCIAVSTCETRVTMIDSNSLIFSENIDFEFNCAIEYSEKTGGFFLEQCTEVDGKQAFLTITTDKNLNETGRWWQGNTEHTCQGFCIDGDYLLCVRWVAQSELHYITVHTLDGEYVGIMPFSGVEGEPENIFRLGDSYYVGCNSSSNIYRVVTVPETWW